MPQIIIHIDEKQLKQLESVMKNNGQTDSENETFSGTEIKISMSAFGHFLEVSGYKLEDLGNVVVEVFDDK